MDKDPSLSRRDFLKAAGVALGATMFPINPSKIDQALRQDTKETEPEFAPAEILIKLGRVDLAELNQADLNAYKIKLQPQPVQGEVYDNINHFPKRHISDLLSDKVLEELKKKNINVQATFGINEADFQHPTLAGVLQSDKYKERVKLQQSVSANKPDKFMIKDIIYDMNKAEIGIDQLLILPSNKTGKKSLAIWTYKGEIKFAEFDSKVDGASIVAPGVIQAKTESGVKLLSVAESMNEISSSASNQVWRKEPDMTPHSYDISLETEKSDEEVFVKAASSGGVYRIATRGGKSAISLWDNSLRDFTNPPVETEEKLDDRTQVFVLGGGYIGYITSPETEPGTPDAPRPEGPKALLKIYNIKSGVKTEVQMTSYAAKLLLEGTYTPQINRSPKEFGKLSLPFRQEYKDIDFDRVFDENPAAALMTTSQASGDNKPEILTLFYEYYDSASQTYKLWAEANPDLSSKPPKEDKPFPPFREVHA